MQQLLLPRGKSVPASSAPALNPVRPLSLCMVSDDFLPAATGVGVHVQSVSRELVRRGHRVTVITTRRKGEPELEDWNGVRVHRTFTLKLYGFYQSLPSRSEIRRIIAGNSTQIVHFHYLGYLLKNAMAVSQDLGLANVYTYHMTEDHLTQPALMRPFRGLIAKQIVKICNRCDLILSPSKNLSGRIQHNGVVTPVCSLSNPVEFSEHVETPEKSPDKFVVLYVGRLHPEKNLPYLLKAFRILAQQEPSAELRIVGEGSERSGLERLSDSLGLQDRVKFAGFVSHDQLPRHYAAADAFVLPSLIETQGMVAMEAMNFSLPVIVTSAIVSARELVDDGVNGFIVNPDSPQELAHRLTYLRRNPARSHEMGRQGRIKTSSFKASAIVEKLEQHYRSVLSSRKGPAVSK